MSVKVSSWVWHDKKTEKVNGNDMLVLLALADVANDNGVCAYFDDPADATYDRLADKARVSRATLVRCIQRLAEAGLLEVTKGRQHAPNSYRILLAQRSHSETSGDSRGLNSDVQRSHLDDPEVSPEDVAPLSHVLDVVRSTSNDKRGTRIPADFGVNDLMRQWAKTSAPAIDLEDETETFKDYWAARPGAGGVKLDWVATWRTWMRRAQKWAVERGWQPAAQTRVVPDGQEWMNR